MTRYRDKQTGEVLVLVRETHDGIYVLLSNGRYYAKADVRALFEPVTDDFGFELDTGLAGKG